VRDAPGRHPDPEDEGRSGAAHDNALDLAHPRFDEPGDESETDGERQIVSALPRVTGGGESDVGQSGLRQDRDHGDPDDCGQVSSARCQHPGEQDTDGEKPQDIDDWRDRLGATLEERDGL
jgi:hypothetical protein